MIGQSALYDYLKGVRETKVEPYVQPEVEISPDMRVSKVISILTKNNVYEAFYFDKDSNKVSSVNVRKLLESRSIESMKVENLLEPLQAVSPSDSVEKVATIMSHTRTRSVPVLEKKGNLGGVVRAQEIMELVLSKGMKWLVAGQLMTPNPIVLDSTDPISKAKRTMTSKRIDHIPVTKNAKIRRVLTSFDLIQIMHPQEKKGERKLTMPTQRSSDSPISNLGTANIPFCNTNDSVSDVIDSLLSAKASCALVGLRDNLHGIITQMDVVKLLERKLRTEIPLYIVGMPEDHPESGVVQEKFTRVMRNVSKVFPDLEEARASIKQQRKQGGQTVL